jgi:TolB protein
MMVHARFLPLLILFAGCASVQESGPKVPITGCVPADHLIQPGEKHFAHLWQLTDGGENAEAYWSFAGDRLVLQRRKPDEGIECDRIFVTQADGGTKQVSNGQGVTTCSFFMPGDEGVLFGSTHGHHEQCPPPPDRSQGYVWVLHPEYDIFVQDLAGGEPKVLVDGWGYDAEATISPLGDQIVFTSTRSGDVELWTCEIDGSNQRQVTDAPGYDGGAFHRHDGKRLIFRSTAFTPGAEEEELADYQRLLAEWLVRPSNMEIMVVDVDGENREQVTSLGKANFAPYFFPDDSRVVFATNHHDDRRPALGFDLFAVDLDGENLEQITFYDEGRGKQFDSFPMFSPDGRYLVFSSNRGTGPSGDTNVFIAEWR